MYVKILAVGTGGFVGALLRYGVSSLVAKRFDHPFPWATLVVNVVGCLAIGYLLGLAEIRQGIPPGLKLFLITGLLGSLTTFSTFSYESLSLLRTGDFGASLMNVGLNLIVGLLAVWAGHLIVSRI